LKKGALYALSTNANIEKNPINTDAKISFYLTSSISSVIQEPTYNHQYGVLIGEIISNNNLPVQYFQTPQTLFFTPLNDYYGTLVIVPYHCNITLSNVSFGLYGDNGFSPDVLFIRVPFPVDSANEAFGLRSDLYDVNLNIIYSELSTVQTFDPSGSSLYSKNTTNLTTAINVQQTSNTPGNTTTTTITGDAVFPHLAPSTGSQLLVNWTVPNGTSNDGKLSYSNISKLGTSGDYIYISSTNSSGSIISSKALTVQYDFSVPVGRKIFIDAFGNKQTFP
jgi:hypothetical protein